MYLCMCVCINLCMCVYVSLYVCVWCKLSITKWYGLKHGDNIIIAEHSWNTFKISLGYKDIFDDPNLSCNYLMNTKKDKSIR